MVLRRAASIAVASTSKRCASSSSSSSSFGVRRHNSNSSSPLGNKTNPKTNNVNIEEMPELTAFDAIGGLLKASTGGIGEERENEREKGNSVGGTERVERRRGHVGEQTKAEGS